MTQTKLPDVPIGDMKSRVILSAETALHVALLTDDQHKRCPQWKSKDSSRYLRTVMGEVIDLLRSVREEREVGR